jgi:ribonuclease HI
VGKIHNFSYRLEFACTNNVIEFKDLLLCIKITYNLGCGHLTIFGDFELVVNLVRKIYSPNNKLMKQYTQTVWALMSNLLSFNITHVKRELNSMVGRLAFLQPLLINNFFHTDPVVLFNLYIVHISLTI